MLASFVRSHCSLHSLAPQHSTLLACSIHGLACAHSLLGQLKFMNMCSRCKRVQWEQTCFLSSLETRPSWHATKDNQEIRRSFTILKEYTGYWKMLQTLRMQQTKKCSKYSNFSKCSKCTKNKTKCKTSTHNQSLSKTNSNSHSFSQLLILCQTKCKPLVHKRGT